MNRIQIRDLRRIDKLTTLPVAYKLCEEFLSHMRDNIEAYCELVYVRYEMADLRLTGLVRPFVAKSLRDWLGRTLQAETHLTPTVKVAYHVYRYHEYKNHTSRYYAMMDQIGANFVTYLGYHLRSATTPPPGRSPTSSVAYRKFDAMANRELAAIDGMDRFRDVYNSLCEQMGLR